MKKYFILLLISSFLFLVHGRTYAGVEDTSKIARGFSKDYAAKKGAVLFRKNIAILDFENLSEPLKEYNVGATVSALLAEEMAHSTIF